MVEDHCLSCHVDGGAASDKPFPESLAIDLVSGAGDYVVPGDPMGSRLWRVLSDQLQGGDRGVMPEGTGPLPPEQRNHVEGWIASGAPHPWAGIDIDGDGFSTDQGDCDESRASVFPGASEVCGDGIDNDCDGNTDDATAVDAESWYVDADQDGFGDAGASPVLACEDPGGSATNNEDCADSDPYVNPDATEVADGDDEDCDGFVDETTSLATDLEPLFATYCSCHVSGVAGVFDLGGDPYDQVVGAPSTQVPAMNLVEPYDPYASYMWLKLNNTQASVGGYGDQMPRLAPPLEQPEMDLIQAWILEGAPP